MTSTPIVVTAADAPFFGLAQSCIRSIREQASGGSLRFVFLDLGCTAQQRDWLQRRVEVVPLDWDFEFPGRDRVPGYLKGLLARPFLRRYFPEHDVYFWIDADAWVQDWRSVELFFQAARLRRGLAVVPELDRGNRLLYGGLPRYRSEVKQLYAMAYGEAVAERFCSYPMLNAGVFALHRDAPHWLAWERDLRSALQKTCTILTDQIALNRIVYGEGLFAHTEFLPAWCNWTCHFGLPRWHSAAGCFVEPYLPHTPIGVLHLTKQKHEQARVFTTEGESRVVRLRYPAGPSRAS